MTRPWLCRLRAEWRRPAFFLARHLKVEHPLPLLFAGAVLLAWDGSGLLRLGLACALLHECGHIAAWRLLLGGWPLVVLGPAGLRIPLRVAWLPPQREMALAAAGPLVNLGLCCLAHGVMAWQGASYAGYWFAAVNLLVGGLNLLPLPGLDGGRILACLLAHRD